MLPLECPHPHMRKRFNFEKYDIGDNVNTLPSGKDIRWLDRRDS